MLQAEVNLYQRCGKVLHDNVMKLPCDALAFSLLTGYDALEQFLNPLPARGDLLRALGDLLLQLGIGAVQGTLVALDWNEVAVRRSHPRCGEVVVHFPRLGYRVRAIG